MNSERIEQIRERAEKATVGDWQAIALGGSSTIVVPALPPRNDKRCQVNYGYKEGKGYCIAYPFLYQNIPGDASEKTRMDFVCFSHADAKFIAHARQDVPALIAEVRRLRDETQALARVAAIDRLFDEAKSWGSWMVTASNERKSLVNRLNASGYTIPHKHTTDAS